MSHKHRNLLAATYHAPPSANIHWREVESLLSHLAASVEPSQGARLRVLLNKAEFYLHHPHGGNVCSKQDIKHLRECLAGAGVTLSLYDEEHGG